MPPVPGVGGGQLPERDVAAVAVIHPVPSWPNQGTSWLLSLSVMPAPSGP